MDPAKITQAKPTMLKDKLKVSSLLSGSADEGKSTHIPKVLQILEMLAFKTPGKKQTSKAPKASHLTERYPTTELCKKLENSFKGHKYVFPKDEKQ